MTGVPELAVIILSVGVPTELKTAVESVLAQPVPLEIVVVNSGGGDPHSVLDGYASVKVISVAHLLWPGAARNLGIASTSAPWVAFLASDLVACTGWAANRLELHKKGQRCIASALINSHPRNIVAWAAHLSSFVRRLPGVPRRKALRYGASYSRSLFEKYGLFREDLRIGEDTEFHRRMEKADRPAWAPAVQAAHRNPTSIRALINDQFDRGRRTALHWPARQQRSPWFLLRVLDRFWDVVRLSFRSVRGLDRLFVVASWPLVLACATAFELGTRPGVAQRSDTGRNEAQAMVAIAILDRDDWSANTDVLVVVDATMRHLVWVPRDLWIASLGDRINAAFATGGGERLVSCLKETGFVVEGLLCLRRSASEAALEETSVVVPVEKEIDFWYPLHPTRPIEEGRKKISFRPPEEILSGERLHQWIGARTMVHQSGSDLLRLRRQQVLLKALLKSKFDFGRAVRVGSLVCIVGKDPLPLLSRIHADWHFTIYGPLRDAVIDGKSVLVRR